MPIETGVVTASSALPAAASPPSCAPSTACTTSTPDTRYEGEIILQPDDVNIVSAKVDPIEVRMRIGMVFQKPNPFPKSIYENVAYGLRVRGLRNRGELDGLVEAALRGAALWTRCQTGSTQAGHSPPGGQQQRLCIARALATEPEIVLFDEPTSALDPIATASIEDLVGSMAGTVTVLIVTHNMQQAARVSKHTAFMYLGELVEYGDTDELFTKPRQQRTSDYLTGRFG